MSTRTLPPKASLTQLKKQAKTLLKAHQSGDDEVLVRLRASVAHLAAASDAQIQAAKFALHDAQRVLAREYGFESWTDLVRAVTQQAANITEANAAFTSEALIEYFRAVRDQDLDTVRRCLEAHPALTEARIHAKDMDLRGPSFDTALRDTPLTERSSTALHLASNSFLKSVDLVQILLDYGADPNAIGFNPNTGHCTSIVIAAWEGGMEKMRLLLEAGADVTGEQGVAALKTAASHKRIDRFDLLVDYGAPASPWMLVYAGLVDRVLQWVDTDPSLLTQRDENGATLLQAAAARMDRWSGNAEAGRSLTKALIERGAHVDVFVAAASNDVETLQTILQDDPDQRDARLSDGATALEYATRAGSRQAVEILLDAGADPNVGYQSPLYQAGRLDDIEICRLLIKHGAAVTDEALIGTTWNSVPQCVRLLLEHGGNPNALVNGWGALHWASKANVEAVRLLLAAGAEVNAPAPAYINSTPLHFALNSAEVVAALLNAGADPTLVDDNGETALDIANRKEQTEVAELLRNHPR